jgi:hypothetical protein
MKRQPPRQQRLRNELGQDEHGGSLSRAAF